ncbi:MAG: hypothetical protein Kow0020_06510 [Wenzhouxiangellaceae bacterium]
MKRLFLAFWLGFVSAAAFGQVDLGNQLLPHNFTLKKTVPYGCLFAVPGAFEVPESGLAFDQTVTVLGSFQTSTPVRLRGWRVGCHEQDASVLLVNFDPLDGQTFIEIPPIVTLRLPGSSEEIPARLTRFNVPHLFDYYLNEPIREENGPDEGATLVVDTLLEDFSRQDYNSELILKLDWILNSAPFEFTIPAYDPVVDVPQFPAPPLHGRYSGQWIVEGLPRQGLVLQVGEIGDRNFLFVVMFTYLNGLPIWTAGNVDFEPGANEVVVNMQLLEGGEFFTEPPGSYAREDVIAQDLGTMTIRANSCNSISADVDFSSSGFGTAELQFERLIRIAGYDCDQTQ